jgi:16S rRNA (adenine1518-N6/adenine1519-N6)-dimethyltransferase
MVKRDELKSMLQAAGIQPKRPLGQNFLTDPNLLKAIARDAEIEPTDVVLEVGTGTSGLTVHLAELAKHVVTVEIDPALAELAREKLADHPNVTLVERDVLARKSKIADEVVETVKAKLAETGGALRVCANLPYAIANPVVLHLLEVDWPLRRMTVMVQLEEAERFLARPGDPQFNSVSVLVAQMATVKMVRKIPPAVFFPRPKIASAVIQLDPKEPRGVRDPVYGPLKTIARSLFNYRRKALGTAAKSASKAHPELECVIDAFARAGIDPMRRAEHLEPEEWRALATECAAALADLELDVDADEGPAEEPEGKRVHKNKYAALAPSKPDPEPMVDEEDGDDEESPAAEDVT